MAGAKMAYVMKKFYPYFWRKFKFPVKDDTELECEKFVKNLRKAVWVHRIVSFRHWHPFVETNLLPMTSSPEMYVSCIFFMVSTTIQYLHNRYEPFMTTCSLVTAVAAYVYDKGYHEFLDYSPTILTVFFEEFHEETFEKFKIWDHFQEYYISNNYSEAYDAVEVKTKGNPFADVIFQLDFVREISLKINSKIPVSEYAAVYHQTQKVMKRFETTGTGGIDRLAVGVAQTRHESVRGPRDDSAKGSRDEGVKELTKSTSKQRVIRLQETCLKLDFISKLKELLKDLEIEKILESEQTSSEEDTESVDLKISPPKLKEPLKDAAKPLIADRVETVDMVKNEDIEVVSKKQSASSISEQSLQDDAKIPKAADREQNVSEMEENREINLKQTSSCQSQEQSLQDDMNMEINLKQASSCQSQEQSLQDDMNVDSTPVESQSVNILSEDIPQLEGENIKAENHSSTAETIDSSQSISTPSKSKKRSKSKKQEVTDSETNLQVRGNEGDIIQTLLVLLQKSIDSILIIYDLLGIPKDD